MSLASDIAAYLENRRAEKKNRERGAEQLRIREVEALERIARPCECYSESAVRFRHGEAQNIARDAIAEGVLPGSEVVVTIVEIRGGKCRVGINAPREISVHREEIQRLIAEEMDSA